jgi:hypothetical protein
MNCQIVGSLLERKARLELTNETIAARMSAVKGTPVSKQSVGHYFSGETGIPLENIGALLHALELKYVDITDICVPKDEHDAMETMAFKYMESRKLAKQRSV